MYTDGGRLMEVAEPLATLVGRTAARAIRVLARTDSGMTGRQVARVAGVASHTGIKRALDKLELAGLVVVERGLQHSSYRANRSHVLWPAIELALEARQELERRIVHLVDRSDVGVISVSVFGSVARGDSTAASDVDLVVVFDDHVDTELIVELGSMVRIWSGNDCQVFDVTRPDLRRFAMENDPLLGSWRDDAKTVYGRDIRDLI
ncbi:nucleotidyltransferase domain-containing protein [Curtobacterium sp. PhB130]|uniref:nucleotidyltransferase domain-containing protein n=1 Tax=Curtobacterium sp. PhB130 TaxID=2485178 RepID=UPI0016179794|nr:nucleotidyltransferase domain-containing protein [Curtobacterium sp. PhB130]